MHDTYLYGDGIFLFLHTNDSFIFVHYFKCQRSNVICFNETTLWEKIQPLNHSRCKKSGVWWSKIINCKPNWFSDFWISFEYISIIYLTYLTTFNKIDNSKPWKNVGVVVGNNEGFELNLDQPIPRTIYGQFIITFKSQTSS